MRSITLLIAALLLGGCVVYPSVTVSPTDTPQPTDTAMIIPTATETPLPPIAVVNVDALNVRSGPGTNYDRIGTITSGIRLNIIGMNEEGDWWKICCLEGGREGWVFGELVSVEGDFSSVQAEIPPTDTPTPTPSSTSTYTPIPTPTQTPTSTFTPLPTPTATLAPTDTPTPEPVFDSRGLGVDREVWEQSHQQSDNMGGMYTYDNNRYWIIYWGNRIGHLEVDFPELAEPTLEDARAIMGFLIPADSVLVETYSPDGFPELIVDLYLSESLKTRYMSTEIDVWFGAEPGTFIVIYGVYDARVARAVMGTGNNP